MAATSTDRLTEITGSFFRNRKWQAIIIFITALAVYANTLRNGYVLDDMAVITHNSFVQKGVDGIPDILTTPSLRGFTERPVYDTAATNDIYRPISLLTFAVERQFFGAAPVARHLVNVLLFAVCAVLLFLCMDRLFGTAQAGIAFIASMLFAVHPIHTEVVANIKSRDELLCFFFAFAALLLYLRYMARGAASMAVCAGIACLLSLFSKETSISFVAIVPVVCMIVAPHHRRRVIVATIVTIAAAVVYVFVRFHILNAHNANHPGLIDFMENPLTGAPNTASRIATAIVVLGHYLRLLALPYPLSCDYTFASIPFATFGDIGVWLTIILYVAAVVYGARRWLKNAADPLAFGIFFYVITLVIFTNLFFLTGSIMAERFLFFPSAGFCLALAWMAHYIAIRISNRRIVWFIIMPVCVLYASLTVARNADWRDNYTLAKADAATLPDNARLQHTLGYVLTTTRMEHAVTGREKTGLVEQGINCYRRSLAIYPAQSKVHTDLANLFIQLQQPDSAEGHFLAALQIQPGEPVIASMLGGLYFAQGRYAKTISVCRWSLLRAPGNIALLNNIGICFLQLKEYDSVIAVSKRVLAIDPANKAAKDFIKAATTGEQAR